MFRYQCKGEHITEACSVGQVNQNIFQLKSEIITGQVIKMLNYFGGFLKSCLKFTTDQFVRPFLQFIDVLFCKFVGEKLESCTLYLFHKIRHIGIDKH